MQIHSKFLSVGIGWHYHWDVLNEQGEAAKERASEIGESLQRWMAPLNFHFGRTLQAARCLNLAGERTIKYTSILLTEYDNRGLDIWMDTHLYAYVPCNSAEILKLPNDHRVIGDAVIAYAQKGLTLLSDYPDFPVEVIQEACDTFRENDYTLHYSSRSTTIKDTKLKGRIDIYFDALSMRRDMTILYRGKELLTKTISHFDRIDTENGACHHVIEIQGRTVTFHPFSKEDYDCWKDLQGPNEFREPASLDLNEFSEALAFIQEKGWVS